MICESLILRDYRNIETAQVDFSDGINVLWGKNAQGKSNLLESIYFFARGKSFRSAKDHELIRFEASNASAELNYHLSSYKKSNHLAVILSQTGKKKLSADGAPITPAEMIGRFRAVLFCPSHLSLISGTPALRRSFLDIAISQVYPTYIDALSRYNHFLMERNALLKLAADGQSVSSSAWETYGEGLASYGSLICKYRLQYLNSISHYITLSFNSMTHGEEEPMVLYHSQAFLDHGDDYLHSCPDDCDTSRWLSEVSAHLFEKLTTNLDHDIHAGTTLHGPHKDDMILRINGKDARAFGSQGQQRSLALALKLAEGEVSRDISGEYPVFLLDDVLSELDESRRHFILQALDKKQIIITSCEPALFDEINAKTTLFQVNQGNITQVTNNHQLLLNENRKKVPK